jgi:hypothetical protein
VGPGSYTGDPRHVRTRSARPTGPSSAPSALGFRLAPAQERTLDAFRTCDRRSGALIDQLRVDGSFTFQAPTQADARDIETCMMRLGYGFER